MVGVLATGIDISERRGVSPKAFTPRTAEQVRGDIESHQHH